MDVKTELEKVNKELVDLLKASQQLQNSFAGTQQRIVELRGVARFLNDQLNPAKEEKKG